MSSSSRSSSSGSSTTDDSSYTGDEEDDQYEWPGSQLVDIVRDARWKRHWVVHRRLARWSYFPTFRPRLPRPSYYDYLPPWLSAISRRIWRSPLHDAFQFVELPENDLLEPDLRRVVYTCMTSICMWLCSEGALFPAIELFQAGP